MCENDYILNPSTGSCENGNYSASIIDNSVITCVEIKDAEAKSHDEDTKTVSTNFNKKYTCKPKKLYILLAFY